VHQYFGVGSSPSAGALDDDQLESRKVENDALEFLEEYLVEKESDGDNVLSLKDLEEIAESGDSAELRAAAQYFVDNKDAREALDSANNPENSFNEKFGIGDIHARRLELSNDIANLNEVQHPDDGRYTLPHEDSTHVTTGAATPEIGQAAYDQQQNAIEEALRTGESVEFRNSDGDIVEVKIEKQSGRKSADYKVTVDGNSSFDVRSEIGIGDTIAGLTTVINSGSTLNVSEGIRTYPDELKFLKDQKSSGGIGGLFEEKKTTPADYTSGHTMRFYRGDTFIQDQSLYNHEIAHGIGRDLDDASWSLSRDASPAGWGEVMKAAQAEDKDSITNYAGESDAENFAEAFSAYINARNHGPEALETFKENYKHQSEYIEREILA